jgi:hypothetical protein
MVDRAVGDVLELRLEGVKGEAQGADSDDEGEERSTDRMCGVLRGRAR